MARQAGQSVAVPLEQELLTPGLVIRGKVLDCTTRWLGKERDRALACYDIYSNKGLGIVVLQVWDEEANQDLVGLSVVAKAFKWDSYQSTLQLTTNGLLVDAGELMSP